MKRPMNEIELYDYCIDNLVYIFGELLWVKRKNGRPFGIIAKNQKESYKIITIEGRLYSIHRIIFLIHYGYLPEYIDHKNRNIHDNRIENLRPCSPSENAQNSNIPANVGCSGIKGVYWRANQKKWAASIKINYKKIHLGQFKNKKDAEEARIQAENIYFNKEFISRG